MTETPRPLHFVVVVLGDLGRSPRMQYHAMSLLQLGDHVRVSLVGYAGESLIDNLEKASDRLDVIRFQVPTPALLMKIRPLYLLWRMITMTVWLLWALLVSIRSGPPVDCLLVQNPPALPLLLVALLFCQIKGLTQLKRPRFIIDWHNLGFSMLENRLIQRVAKAYELLLAPMADGHLTVTRAMKSFLLENTKIRKPISVLYDGPPAMFSPLEPSEQHKIMQKLHRELLEAIPKSWGLHHLDESTETILTKKLNDHSFGPRQGRPALITSSTSWTPDEDFGVLLNALVLLDAMIQSAESLLKVLVVVTGKGPQKAMYQEKLSKLIMSSVAVQTVWLQPGDYPKLLACADLGVSLHTSTSGLDLPMKVLDLAGCQVPVCAVEFDCLHELVQDKHNGRTFQTDSQLADQFWSLLSPLTKEPAAACHSFGDLAVYSENLKGRTRWDDNWIENARPLLLLDW